MSISLEIPSANRKERTLKTLHTLIMQIAFMAITIFSVQAAIAADNSPEKEKAWKAFYQKPEECKGLQTNAGQIGRCIEHKNKEREKFDTVWDSRQPELTPTTPTTQGSTTQEQKKKSTKGLNDLTEKIVEMLIYGMGGAVVTFFVVSLGLILAGLRGQMSKLAVGIGGLAAIGWLWHYFL